MPFFKSKRSAANSASHSSRSEEDDAGPQDTHTHMVLVAAPHPDLALVDPAQLIIDQTQELTALRVTNAQPKAKARENFADDRIIQTQSQRELEISLYY